MARGKYVTKKDAAAHPPALVGRRVGRAAARGSSALPAALPAASDESASHMRVRQPVLGVAVMSPWGWRIMAVATMIAVGLCATFFLDGKTVIGALWVLVCAGWAAFTFRLWRLHLDWDRA